MLAQFPNIAILWFFKDPSKHSTRHYSSTKEPPIHAQPMRLSHAELAITVSEFSWILYLGVSHCLSCLWASPLHVVQKASGDWHPYGDYHCHQG